MPATRDDTTIPIDWSQVRSEQVRSRIGDALRDLGRSPDPSPRFWRSLGGERSSEEPRNVLVLADLSECARLFRAASPHAWASSLRTIRPLIVALVRGVRDRDLAAEVDEIARTSGGRFLVCDLGSGSAAETAACVARALAGLDPHAVRDVRYSVEERSLWLEFGDGLEGSLRWDALPIGDRAAALRPETATVADGGASVQVLRADGDVFDIDASSLRALLDDTHARRLAADAGSSAAELGRRLREHRTATGLTQVDLAAKSGLEQALISRLESGRHRPRFDTLEKYAGGLGMTVSDLLR